LLFQMANVSTILPNLVTVVMGVGTNYSCRYTGVPWSAPNNNPASAIKLIQGNWNGGFNVTGVLNGSRVTTCCIPQSISVLSFA